MSKHNSNPHKSGDNGGSTEEPEIDVVEFSGDDIVAEAGDADDDEEDSEYGDDIKSIDGEEFADGVGIGDLNPLGDEAGDAGNDEIGDEDDEEQEEVSDDEEKEYDVDDPRDVIEWVLEECDDDTELDSAEQDFVNAIADVDDSFIDDNFDEIEERFPPLGLELHEYIRVTNQVDIYWELNEASPCVCNLRGCFMELMVTEDGVIYPLPLLNFEIKLEEKIRLPDDGVTAEFTVDHADKQNVTKQVPPSVFGDKRKFKEEILSTYYSTVFETDEEKQALRDIGKYIGSIDVKTIQGVHGVGFGGENTEFVTPSGCIDESGWVDDPKHKIIEPHGETSVTRDYIAEPGADDIDVDEVREITELLCQIRPGERFTPILSWFFSTPFRSKIEDKEGMFNHLNITGESGSGKTQTVRLLMRLLGFDIEPFEIDDTSYSIDQKLANVRDCPVWFDEYIPSRKSEYELDRFHGKFKLAATGGVSTRGDYNGDNKTWDLSAPIVVTGESEISSNAESRRTVNIRISDSATGMDECVHAFKRLTGATDIDVDDDDEGYEVDFNSEYNLAGFAEHFYSFAASRVDDFESLWRDAQRRAHEISNSWDIDLGDDEVQGLATVCFGYELLHEFADEHGVDGDVLPEEDELEQSLRNVAGVDANGEGTGRMTEEDEFLSLFARACSAEYVEKGTDFEIVRAGKEREELRINVARCYDKISRYARDHDLNVNLLSDSSEYKSRFRQMEDEVGNYIKTTSQRTPPVARCTGVSVVEAAASIADFDAAAIEGTQYVQENHEEDESDDGCVDPVANRQVSKLESVDYSGPENAEISVTVDVVEWEEDTEGKAVDACVQDCSGVKNLVAFDAPNGYSPNAGDSVLISGVGADVWQGDEQLKLAGSDVEIRRISEGSGFVGGDEDTGVEVLE